MLGYLSTDINYLFPEANSFLRAKAIVFIIPQISFTTHAVFKIGEYHLGQSPVLAEKNSVLWHIPTNPM